MDDTATTAGRFCSAVVLALCTGLWPGAPAQAHPGEGATPYRYVVAPPGVTSEGAAASGLSTQPTGPAAFAGTTDNQMQLTLPAGALPARAGEQGVRVQLDQLDPALLPSLPTGLEPEGNGYQVQLAYAPSGTPVTLAAPATLSVSAPAAPTGVLELVDGRWVPLRYTHVAAEAGFSSVVEVDEPITLMQVYDPADAPPPPSAAAATRTATAPGAASPPPGKPSAATGRPDHALVPAVATLGLLSMALAAATLVTRRRRPAGQRT